MPVRSSSIALVFSALVLTAAGCGNREEHPGGSDQHYELRGQVLAVDSSSNRLTIAHGDIPRYMKAMTMTFKVKDPGLLFGVQSGDSVRGILAVHRPEVWIDSLTVLSKMSSETRH